MAVKKGYKQTEVGVIPEDWDCAQIGQLATTSSGTTPSRSSYDRYFKNGSINWVKTLDLNNGIVAKTDERVTAKALDETSLSVFPTGTVLVAMYGGFMQIGRTGILAIPACVNQALTAIKCNIADLKPAYLLWVLNHRVEYWKSVASSSRKDPNITSKEIREFPIPLPPTLAEQEAIAGALSDADAWIESLEQLIAKKRQIKQGAMQELLTGKRRLPGFSGKWETKQISDIAVVGRGRVISHVEISRSRDPKYPVFSSQTFNDGVMGYIDTFDFDGDYITWTTDGANAGTVFARSGRFNCTNVCGTIKVQFGNHRFIALALGSVAKSHVSRHLGNPKLMNDVLKRIAITIPSNYYEQNSVATVLSDMDTEIESLESKLAKAREIKQGMMQELLTGKIRLVKSSAVSANPQEMSHDR